MDSKLSRDLRSRWEKKNAGVVPVGAPMGHDMRQSGSTIPGEQSSPSQDIDTPTPVTTESTPVTD